jgi:hypothetical protein
MILEEKYIKECYNLIKKTLLIERGIEIDKIY